MDLPAVLVRSPSESPLCREATARDASQVVSLYFRRKRGSSQQPSGATDRDRESAEDAFLNALDWTSYWLVEVASVPVGWISASQSGDSVEVGSCFVEDAPRPRWEWAKAVWTVTRHLIEGGVDTVSTGPIANSRMELEAFHLSGFRTVRSVETREHSVTWLTLDRVGASRAPARWLWPTP
jgi:hypothetical protein